MFLLIAEGCIDEVSRCCLTDDDFLSASDCDALGGVLGSGPCFGGIDDRLCAANGFVLGTWDNAPGFGGRSTLND